ncbi:uncharacterized protein RSE6_11951 [Rhynchosporium secalis]|uniref:Uncharacterized protein n=1 Tax=Rhynchosporium secalis TaxID=38038 RepID=A0A1E1MP70_RHYSE|nr:uncharacterized protein RSE6_11951 [Rhynchosporium secalis]
MSSIKQTKSQSSSTSTTSSLSSSDSKPTFKKTSPRSSLHEDEYTTTPSDYSEHNIQTIDFAPGSLVAQSSGDAVVERKKSLVKRAGSLGIAGISLLPSLVEEGMTAERGLRLEVEMYLVPESPSREMELREEGDHGFMS